MFRGKERKLLVNGGIQVAVTNNVNNLTLCNLLTYSIVAGSDGSTPLITATRDHELIPSAVHHQNLTD
jgi:acyl CoA:acetate/3-ketoacid CoA transferase beta subunit